MVTNRRSIIPDEENGLERKPLQFSIADEDEEDELQRQQKIPPSSGPPPIFRNVRESHRPPTYAQVLVNRVLLKYFPKFLLGMFAVLFVVALLPGGWRVALCTGGLLVPPSFAALDENVTIIGHRGSEFPYPENSVQAITFALNTTNFIEFDVALTSDQSVILMHDIAFEKTTVNGTGLTCMSPLSYAESLELAVPERNPQGALQHGSFCVRRRPNGAVGTVPCTYRVPTLDQVFEFVPDNTRFMIDIKECYAPNITVSASLCSNCTVLQQQISRLMETHFVNPKRIVFTSSQRASLAEFQKGMNVNASFALSMDPTRYSHYKARTVIELLDEYKFDAVSMHVALAAVRPDLVYAIRNSRHPTNKHRNRDIYIWTIRRDYDFKVARCTGASRLIAAQPERLKRNLLWSDYGDLITDEP